MIGVRAVELIGGPMDGARMHVPAVPVTLYLLPWRRGDEGVHLVRMQGYKRSGRRTRDARCEELDFTGEVGVRSAGTTNTEVDHG